MATTYQTEWARDLIKDALSAACHDAWRLVHQQPAGWAQDGMLSRLDGVMRSSLEERMRVACREAPYHPPELLTTVKNERALSAFDRLCGARPDIVRVAMVQMDKSPIDGSWTLRATVVFCAWDPAELRVQADVTIKREILEQMSAKPTV